MPWPGTWGSSQHPSQLNEALGRGQVRVQGQGDPGVNEASRPSGSLRLSESSGKGEGQGKGSRTLRRVRDRLEILSKSPDCRGLDLVNENGTASLVRRRHPNSYD